MHSSAARPEWTDVCAEIEAGLKRRVAPLPSAIPSAVRRKPRVRNAVGMGSRPVHRWQTSGGGSKDGCQDVQKKTKLMGDAPREDGTNAPMCQSRIKRVVLQPCRPVGSSHRERSCVKDGTVKGDHGKRQLSNQVNRQKLLGNNITTDARIGLCRIERAVLMRAAYALSRTSMVALVTRETCSYKGASWCWWTMLGERSNTRPGKAWKRPSNGQVIAVLCPARKHNPHRADTNLNFWRFASIIMNNRTLSLSLVTCANTRIKSSV